ncbi:MAG: glycosyltransferase family 4 protein [Cyanobium sp. M30B3]|nr:MAG: glycosyltransferase family 4 protein [Cyanobium sp. M30B3]
MKLLHIIPRFIGGGPERHLLALAEAWRSAGLQTRQRILVLDPPASAPLLIKARRLGIELLIAPDLSAIRNAIAEADIVEVEFWNHPRLHDLLRQELPQARWILRSAVAGTTPPQVLTEAIGSVADMVIVSTDASLQTPAVCEARARNCRLESIPALADMKRLEGITASPHVGIRVGYLGLVEPTKMHPRFARLAAHITNPEVQIEIYGGGSWKAELQQQFEGLGMSDRVRFHGHVEDIRSAFATMDIFGYPLVPETFATSEKTIQEAMWAGIPPVVLAGTGATLLVQHEHTGLVCEHEADYPHAIDRLAGDPILRRRLGEAAHAFARETFDPVRNAARFHEIFETALSLRKRPHVPLPGRDAPGALRFVQSLGMLGHAFQTSLMADTSLSKDQIGAAEDAIRHASPVMTQGEGGIVHYRNTYPQDPHLHYWCGLISLQAGNWDGARREFDAAIQLGLDRARVQDHLPNPAHAA